MTRHSIPVWGFGSGLLVVLLAALPSHAAEQNRERLTADFGWKFIKADPAGADKPEFDDGSWRTLDLPHDWSIEGPYSQTNSIGGGGGFLPAGIGWYRRAFTAPEPWRDKSVFV